MRNKSLNGDQPEGKVIIPGFGSMMPKALELFERALDGKKHFQEKIEKYASSAHPTVRELLLLEWFRNWLSFLKPKLPDGDSPTTAAGLWQYWNEHPDEFLALTSAGEEIISYLESTDQLKADRNQGHVQMHELIKDDELVFAAWYPFVEELYKKKKRGAPVTRRLVAVRALQMQVDGNSLRRVTQELCDCGKGKKVKHGERCEQQMRQSILSLTKLLQKCGIEFPIS
jgi:hypothetical protein